jgi:hypothetical protein
LILLWILLEWLYQINNENEMIQNNNPIVNPMAGPMANFLQDPAANLRRRMNAILAEVADQINRNRNQSAIAGRLADWFFDFREALRRNADINAIVQQHVPRFQALFNDPNFQTAPIVQHVLQTLIPRILAIFGQQLLPNLPPPPQPAPAPRPNANNNDEAVRQIRARVLGNQARRAQMDVQIGQQFDQQMNAALQGVNNVMQTMQRAFQTEMGRLDAMAQEDQARVQIANRAIDAMEQTIADVQNAFPNLDDRVQRVNEALNDLERSIAYAKQEVAQLNDAINRRNAEESNSVWSAALCIAACIMVKLAFPELAAVPIPGGMQVGLPPFTF